MNAKRRLLIVGLTSAALALPAIPVSGAPAVAQTIVPAAVVVPAAEIATRTLSISPVANAAGGSITAKFLKSDYVKNRRVVLMQWTGSEWVQATKAKVKMSSKGVAVFKLTPSLDTTYKAVAPVYKYKKKGKKRTAPAVETAEASASVSRVFYDDFTAPSTDLDSAKWSRTRNGDYGVAKRWCSAPSDANAKVSSSYAYLTMSKPNLDSSTKAMIIAEAKAAQKAAGETVEGCPNGIYSNARVSTEGNFSIQSGIIAAKVKFPKAQGMHGGIWLRTSTEGGSELDMVEAFGFRKGIQNVVHIGVRDTSGPNVYETKEAKKWVAKSAVKKSSWWNKYHVFSMEWNSTTVTFRLDGKITKVEKPTTGIPVEDYYIVMSMLSSDWETGRLTKPANHGTKAKLPESMKVDWVKAWTSVG